MRVVNQLSDLGKEIDNELFAALMLQGLPEKVMPMRLALENANIALTIDYIETKLFQLDNSKVFVDSSTPELRTYYREKVYKTSSKK